MTVWDRVLFGVLDFNAALTRWSHKLGLRLKALTGGSLNRMVPFTEVCKIGQNLVTRPMTSGLVRLYVQTRGSQFIDALLVTGLCIRS